MTATAGWSDLERQAPALAAAGRRLLKVDAIPIAFAATVARGGAPRLAPVCPIFADGHVYLSVGAHTPKVDDLARDGRFALHAFLGPADEENVGRPDTRAIRTAWTASSGKVHETRWSLLGGLER